MKLKMLYEDVEYLSLNSSIDDLRHAFDSMEGDGFFDRSMEGEYESLGEAYEQLGDRESWSDDEPKDIIMSVYGDGGWHR